MPDIKSKRTRYLERKQALWSERSSFFPHWQELSKFLLPRSGRFVATDRNKGDKRYNNIIDNTGTRSLGILSAGLMAGMTSPARPWFRLATRDKALMDFAPVKQWLEFCTTLMRDIFNVSNTYRSLHTQYEEIACFGTGADLLLPDFQDVIRHYPLTIGEYALAANDRQEIDTLVREFELTVSQIVKRYVAGSPENAGRKSGAWDWSNVSTTIKNLYDRGTLDAWIPVIQIIEPREDREQGKYDAKNMPFASCTFESGGNEEKLLNESGYRRFPVLASRWHALGGDVYATRCPGMESLGDVKQLQHANLRKAQALDYLVKPPIQAPHGTKSHEVDLLPGGVTITNMMGPGGGIKPAFEVKPDLQGQLMDIQDMRERIRSTHFADLFLMIAMNERNQPDTAREIAEKHEEKMLMLGPVLTRLHNELLERKIDITFDKMLEADIVPPPPPEMQGQEITVEFVSMLAQAQRAISTQNVDRYVASMGIVAQFKPGVLDKFDEDKWADEYADALGVSPDMIVSNDKVAIIRDERAKAAQAQQRMAQAEQMAKTVKDAAAAPTGNGQSALTDVMSTLSGYTGPGLPNAI